MLDGPFGAAAMPEERTATPHDANPQANPQGSLRPQTNRPVIVDRLGTEGNKG